MMTSTPSTNSNTGTTNKNHKQRKTSLKLLEQQNAHDSGDDNQQQQGKPRHHHHHHKKIRVPRALSPLQPKPSLNPPSSHTSSIPISSNSKSEDFISSNSKQPSPISSQMIPTVAITNDNEFKKSASSNSLTAAHVHKTHLSNAPSNSIKPVKFSNQQRNFPRSLSKSFSSSSSSSSPPPPMWFNHPVS